VIRWANGRTMRPGDRVVADGRHGTLVARQHYQLPSGLDVIMWLVHFDGRPADEVCQVEPLLLVPEAPVPIGDREALEEWLKS